MRPQVQSDSRPCLIEEFQTPVSPSRSVAIMEPFSSTHSQPQGQPPPPPSSSLAHAPVSTRSRSFLADVEIHCVFHFLNASQRMRMARCNRRLLLAAGSPFAWKHVALKLTQENADKLVQSRSAQCIQVAFHLTRPSCRVVDVSLLLSLPLQFRELHTTHSDGLTPALWHRILADPVMNGLRVLRMHDLLKKRLLDAEALRLIALLPHLHTLALSVIVSCPPAAAFEALANAPALTSLETNDCLFHRGRSRLPFISQCSRLTSLTVSEPTLSVDMLRPMRSLTSLRFENYRYAGGFVTPMTRDEYAAFFTPMLQLTSLTLCDCFGVGELISASVHATSLRSLVIQMGAADPTLTAALLLHVLSSASQLHLAVKFLPQCFRPFDFFHVEFARFLPGASVDPAAPLVDPSVLDRFSVGLPWSSPRVASAF